MTEKLTSKQQRFCEEYVKDCNGTQAAIRAGYSPKTSKEQASRLLTYANVLNYIKELREAMLNDISASVQERKILLSRIACDDNAYPRDQIHAIAELNKMEGSYQPAKLDLNDEREQQKRLMVDIANLLRVGKETQ